jgi:flavin reductase (DIM6/NTAB) family NADH-FMN oxidoreductase RutF
MVTHQEHSLPARESASATEYAEAMSALASGVVLVTYTLEGRPCGVTVTAFASVSAAPPTVLVSLGSRSRSVRAIAAAAEFGVNILAAGHAALARFGASPGADRRLERFTALDGCSRTPIVAGAVAHLDCVLSERVHIADHDILLGSVREARALRAAAPLVYHGRRYRTLAGPDRSLPPMERSIRCASS